MSAKELAEQLRLAKEEGLPATSDDISAVLPQVAANGNAAPLYEKLSERKDELKEIPESLAGELTKAPSAALKDKARKVLKEHAGLLAEADKAVRLQHCRFDRQWDYNSIEFSKEWVAVSQIARLYMIQAALAYSEGRFSDSAKALQNAWTMSQHLGEVPNSVAQMFCRATQRRAFGLLASWIISHPESAELRKLLARFESEMAAADPRADQKMMLVSLLSLVELCQSDEGRQKLGLRPADVETIINDSGKSAPSGGPNKVELIKAAREYWKALSFDSNRIDAASGKAADKIKKQLEPYPLEYFLAAQTFLIFKHAYSIEMNEQAARKLQCTALNRAVAEGKIQTHIKTDDLKSPWTGDPLVYYADDFVVHVSIIRDQGQSPLALRIFRTKGSKK